MTLAFSKSKRRAMICATSLFALAAGMCAVEAGDLTGKVVDAQKSYSLDGAVVEIKLLGLKTRTDNNGRFRFPGLAAGTYELTISYVGASPVKKSVTLNSDEESITVAIGSEMEEIVVTGLRGSMNSSLNKKRASDVISEFLSSDAVGDFPDQNIAEAARRMVGLSVETDQGEARYVVVRGIDPALNSSAVNGVRLPSPEGDSRQVALDVIPSELIETLAVSKSATPDMDGDFIGGNIDVKTLSGFDYDERHIKIKLEGGYNALRQKLSPKTSFTYAEQLSDTLAFAGSISWYRRVLGADNFEVDGGWINEDDDGTEMNSLIPAELEMRDYNIIRTRLGIASNLDFRPNANNDFYLRSLFSKFKDDEARQRVEAKFEKGVFAAGNTATDIFVEGADVDRDIKDRIETQQIVSTSVGGESRVDLWTFDYSVALSNSEEVEDHRLDTGFRQKDINFGVNVSDPMLPKIIFADPADQAAFTDMSAFKIDSMEQSDNLTQDKDLAIRLDVRREMTFGNDYSGYLKTGFKYSDRNKFRTNKMDVYDDFDAYGDILASEFPYAVDYDRMAAFGATGMDRKALWTFFNSNKGQFGINDEDSLVETYGANFDVDENITAGYLMGSMESANWRMVGGVRLEHTRFDATAYEVTIGDALDVVEKNFSKSYSNWLPSLNMRYNNDNEDVVLRAAYNRSVIRPKFVDAVPSGLIEVDEGAYEGEFGNPDLSPYFADNFDLGVSFYPNNDSILSAGVFYKNIDNFHFDQVYKDYTYSGILFDEVSIVRNGEGASVSGLELNYQQALTMLPAPFDGLIVGANYTYTDSKGHYRDEDDKIIDIPMPKTSKNVTNFILGYEKAGLELRAALSYRDDYLDEVNGDGDRYVLSKWKWDISGSYEVVDGFEIYSEISNLTNSEWRAAHRINGKDYIMQSDIFDITVNVGMKATF